MNHCSAGVIAAITAWLMVSSPVSAQEHSSVDVHAAFGNVVVLIDASGSMGPYYTDGHAAFVEFLGTIIDAAIADGSTARIYSFSKVDAAMNIASPTLYAEGLFNEGAIAGRPLADILNSIRYHPAGNTDLWEALSAIKQQMNQIGGGIIWLLTDNIQDPKGQLDTGDINRFYDNLRKDRTIQKIIAFPVRRGFPGCTMLPLLYGIIYAEQPISPQVLMHTPIDIDFQALTNAPSIHCKPLDRDILQIMYPSSDRGVELRDIRECSEKAIQIDGLQIRSNYPSHNVRSNSVRAVLRLITSTDSTVPLSSIAGSMQPSVMSINAQDTSSEYSIFFTLPAICPSFAWSTCFKSNFMIGGNLTIEAEDVSFALRDDLDQIMGRVYGLRQLPAFFRPELAQVKSATFPLTIFVAYSWKRTLLALGIPLLILAACGAFLYYILTNPQYYAVSVDGHELATRKLRWYGERFPVYADEFGTEVLIGSLVYKWFGGMFFFARRPFSILESERGFLKLSKSDAFVVQTDSIKHHVSYTHLSKSAARTKAAEASDRPRYD